MSDWKRIQKDLLCFILINKASLFKPNQNNRYMIKRIREIGTRNVLNTTNMIYGYFGIFSVCRLSDRTEKFGLKWRDFRKILHLGC